MYLHIWSIVVIRNWHWCQVRVHTLTYLRTVREFMYVDLNRNHQSTHKFDYNFFWMGVTNWNFYHLAENVFTAFVLEQREQKECRQIREGGGHCSTVNSGATRTPACSPHLLFVPRLLLHNPWRIDAESVTEFLRALHMLQRHLHPCLVATYSHSTVSPVAIINS